MCENSFLYLAVFKLKYVKGINLCLTLRSHQEIDCREEFQNIKLRRVPRRIHYNLIPAVILFTVHFKRGHQKVNFFPHFSLQAVRVGSKTVHTEIHSNRWPCIPFTYKLQKSFHYCSNLCQVIRIHGVRHPMRRLKPNVNVIKTGIHR